MSKNTVLTADVDYISGHLRYGHFELTLDEEELEAFKRMGKEEQMEYFRDRADLLIDDFYVSDLGEIGEIVIHK